MVRRILQQPPGFYSVSMTKWLIEAVKFSLGPLLLIYLVQQVHLSDTKAYLLYGIFSSLTWIFCILGGYIGDQLLGVDNTVIMGLLCYIFGAFLMAINFGDLYFPLSMIALGGGLCEPNILTLIGSLYHKQAGKR